MLRYWKFQIPGWILAGLVLVGLYRADVLEGPLCLLLFMLWVMKDLVLFPLLWRSYRPERAQGRRAMLGQRAVLETSAAPHGRARYRGELWQARVPEGAPHLPAGVPVRITALDGLVLIVEADGGE